MSYEHCEKHDEEATNGCESCDKEERARLVLEVLQLICDTTLSELFARLMRMDTLDVEKLRDRLK